MTREEAIEVLKANYPDPCFQILRDAVDVAIEALKAQGTCQDTISRQAAIDVMCLACGQDCDKSRFVYNAPQDEQVIICPEHYALSTLPSAQPDNQINLCDSCKHTYPVCPSGKDDVIFGNGIGNDNICACAKYVPSTRRTDD